MGGGVSYPLCECEVCQATRPRMPRRPPLPPSMRPLPVWQWVAGTIAFLVIVLILLIGGQ